MCILYHLGPVQGGAVRVTKPYSERYSQKMAYSENWFLTRTVIFLRFLKGCNMKNDIIISIVYFRSRTFLAIQFFLLSLLEMSFFYTYSTGIRN